MFIAFATLETLPNVELFLVNKKGEMITARATKSGARNYLYQCEKR